MLRHRAARQPLPPGFGAIWSCVALDLVGFGIVLPILPLYARRFGATPATIGALVASFSLAQLVFAPLWGRVSDRVGRKPVLVLSLAGTAVGSLVTGLAGTLWLLFLGRVVDGISGASVSVAQAAVADVAPPEQRARLLGLLGAAFGVGFVAGPAVGALAALGGPHVPFLLAAVIAGVNAVVAARRLPETNAASVRHGSRHVPGGGADTGGAAAPPSPGEGGLLVGAEGQEDGLAVGPERHEGAGVGSSRFAGYVAVTFVAMVAFSAFEATFSLFGERRLSFDEASAGAVFAAVGVLITLVQVGVVQPCVARFGEAGALMLGLLLDAAGLVALAGVRSWLALVPALVLLTVGQGLVTPTLSSLVAGRARADRRGGALGTQQAAAGLARVVGPAAGGLLFQHAGPSTPYLAGAALVLGAAVLLTASRRSTLVPTRARPVAGPVHTGR